MDRPHQESLTIGGKLSRSNAEKDRQVPSEWIEGQTEAHSQIILIKGHKPGLVTVGISSWYFQGKVIGEVVLLPNPI